MVLTGSHPGSHLLRVSQGPRRIKGSEMNVGPTRHDTITAILAPSIRRVGVQYDIHCLIVCCPIELLLFLHNGHVHFHLLKCAELGEPWL